MKYAPLSAYLPIAEMSLRVRHLNCGTMCPPARRLVHGSGSVLASGRMVAHCLLIETEAGLILVDSGFGLADVADPAGRLGKEIVTIARPRLDETETAARQLERLGYRREDVRHIVLTHLDLDHAGGLADFPHAEVHVHEDELAAASAPRTAMERRRYRPAQWAHGPRWVRHRTAGERWMGFEAVRALDGVPPEILLVPLHGHSRGHCGVAVDAGGSWLLHAGDAYFHRDEVHASARRCPPGLEMFQRMTQVDAAARLANQARLRELARAQAGAVRVFSAHDPFEYARMA